MSDQQSRTEKPTPRKRQESRKKGQVLRSTEVSSAFTFGLAVVLLYFIADRLFSQLRESLQFFLVNSTNEALKPGELVQDALGRGGLAGLPFVAVALSAGVTGAFLQARPTFTFEPFQPQFSKLSPAKGLKRLFSLSGLSRLLRGVLGLAALAYVGWSVIRPELTMVHTLADLSVAEIAIWAAGLVGSLFVRAALVFVILASIDYSLNYRQHERSLMMTKHEIKEEHKLNEGHPEVKKRVKKLQRQMAQRRMMAEVPKATLVITNPTHVAVALAYDREKNPAPRVVAKGKGELAQRIRDIARRNEVVIYEDPPLARALYSVELGSVIPAELYKAVAEVLAHLVKISAIRF